MLDASTVADLHEVKTICVHADCADGLASALVLHDIAPRAQVRFLQHGTPALRDLVAAPGMIFCDITPPAARVADFVRAGAIVLDHHGTARATVAAFGARGVFADETAEPGVSGAMLAYREAWVPFYGDGNRTLHDFAMLAGIRDTWQRGHARWTEACEQAMALLFWPAEQWLATYPGNWNDLTKIGPVLFKRRADAVARAVREAWRFTSASGTRVVVFEGLDLTSDAAEVLGATVDVVAGFGFTADGDNRRVIYSLRSHASFDCARWAKAEGGGGHTRAAGFTVPLDETTPQPYEALHQHLEAYEINVAVGANKAAA